MTEHPDWQAKVLDQFELLKDLDGKQVTLKERNEVRNVNQLRGKIIPFILKLDAIEKVRPEKRIVSRKLPCSV